MQQYAAALRRRGIVPRAPRGSPRCGPGDDVPGAQFLAPEFGARLVLINPSVQPDVTLAPHAGRYPNEATGGETVLAAVLEPRNPDRLPEVSPRLCPFVPLR